MTKSQVIAIVIGAAAVIVGVVAVWLQFGKTKIATWFKPASNTFDPRTWSLSDSDYQIVNSLTKAQQDDVKAKWEAAIAANPLQSGEGLYKLLIRQQPIANPIQS